ncbi:hypothetical protein EA58_19655 [Photobacterium galatheae]|uniref:Uncharacterized protein n=1 Tax=Photobacterium galatheae TaxID=1654360 RepID=A0A066RQJ0_9GAMM|nr:hypothetical protein EA58_19655 [Photobacterium galatheae]
MIFASGCSSFKDVEPIALRFNEESFSNDSISTSLYKLSESAEVAANAQRALAELANGMASQQMTRAQYNEYVFQKSYIPRDMERSVGDIEWSGPAMPLLKVVAEMAGYVVAEPAHKPLFEPIVRLNTVKTGKQLNVNDVIRAIEASNKEEISIDIIEDSKIININYFY